MAEEIGRCRGSWHRAECRLRVLARHCRTPTLDIPAAVTSTATAAAAADPSDDDPLLPPAASRGLCFEEWRVGRSLRTARRTLADSTIVDFVSLVGYTEPLFQDVPYMRALGHRRRLAPGLLTTAVADALIVQTGCLDGFALALLGLSNVVARAPVYAGDTLQAAVAVTGARLSRSQPDRGVVTTAVRVLRVTGGDEDGGGAREEELVLTYDVARLIRVRASGAAEHRGAAGA